MTDTRNVAQIYSCFVIGPIGNKFAQIGSPERTAYEDALDVFENVILPACQLSGLEPVRADQIAATGEINEQIFRHLLEDDIVIADVSGGNPNVMYELGLRHTRPKVTIPIGEYGQLPFDFNTVRTIQFSRSARGLIDARNALERALVAGLGEPPEPVTATRVWLSDFAPAAGSPSTDIVVVDESLGSDDDDLDEAGLVDRLAEIEMRFPLLTETAEQIGATIEQMGAVAMDSSAEVNAANAAGASAAARLGVIAKFAQHLQPSADDLTRLTDAFREDMASLDEEVVGILHHLESNPATESDAEEFVEAIAGTARSARETMENMSQFEGSVAQLADVSRTLRRPVKQITGAVRTMVNAMAFADSWESKAIKVRQAWAQSGEGARSAPLDLN